MFCDCGKSGKAGFTRQQDSDLWLCGNCRRPSRMVVQKLTLGHAPQRATGITSVVGTGDGRHILTWSTNVSGERIKTVMFHPYPRKVDMQDQGRNICLELWTGLDSMIDEIRNVQIPEHTRAERQIEARLLAKVIALVMAPFYEDDTAVLRESMTRWKARQDGQEHESPGLAEAIWNPNTRFDGTPYSEDSERRTRAGSAPKAKVVFDEQKITFIKHCLENGLQTPEALAGMFNCSIEDIKAVVA